MRAVLVQKGQRLTGKSFKINADGFIEKNSLDDLLQLFPKKKQNKLIWIFNNLQIKELEDFAKYRPKEIMIRGISPSFFLELKLSLLKLGFQYDSDDEKFIIKRLRELENKGKSDVLLSLRFEVLKRDKFRCQYCGRSPKADESIILHVDHIQPKSKGGYWKIDNLITSCFECNLGKGDILLTSRRKKR